MTQANIFRPPHFFRDDCFMLIPSPPDNGLNLLFLSLVSSCDRHPVPFLLPPAPAAPNPRGGFALKRSPLRTNKPYSQLPKTATEWSSGPFSTPDATLLGSGLISVDPLFVPNTRTPVPIL